MGIAISYNGAARFPSLDNIKMAVLKSDAKKLPDYYENFTSKLL